jgi:hypothetical protein
VRKYDRILIITFLNYCFIAFVRKLFNMWMSEKCFMSLVSKCGLMCSCESKVYRQHFFVISLHFAQSFMPFVIY